MHELFNMMKLRIADNLSYERALSLCEVSRTGLGDQRAGISRLFNLISNSKINSCHKLSACSKSGKSCVLLRTL